MIISVIAAAFVLALLLAVGVMLRRVMQRLYGLERSLAEYRAQAEEALARYRAVPGVVPGEREWVVIVGGRRIAIRPLSGAQWLEAIKQLPEFIYAYAQDRVKSPEVRPEHLERVVELARRWIGACAGEEVDLATLTVPEAEHAVTQIAELNGITANMREFFRERLAAMAGPAPHGSSLRRAPERPNRPN